MENEIRQLHSFLVVKIEYNIGDCCSSADNNLGCKQSGGRTCNMPDGGSN